MQGTLSVLLTKYPHSTIGSIPLYKYAIQLGHSKSTLHFERPRGTLTRKVLWKYTSRVLWQYSSREEYSGGTQSRGCVVIAALGFVLLNTFLRPSFDPGTCVVHICPDFEVNVRGHVPLMSLVQLF